MRMEIVHSSFDGPGFASEQEHRTADTSLQGLYGDNARWIRRR
jgi:hypothetical protein